jgi:Uma2 family endonuclease
MSITIATWTTEQYHELINTGVLADRRVELLAGSIVDMAPEGMSHAVYCGRAVTYLRSLLTDRAHIRETHPNEGYTQETKFSSGLVTPLRFPNLNIEVRKLFSI